MIFLVIYICFSVITFDNTCISRCNIYAASITMTVVLLFQKTDSVYLNIASNACNLFYLAEQKGGQHY